MSESLDDMFEVAEEIVESLDTELTESPVYALLNELLGVTYQDVAEYYFMIVGEGKPEEIKRMVEERVRSIAARIRDSRDEINALK